MAMSPIAGMIQCSLLDFPGQISSVLFFRDCPWKCGFCHNHALISGEWDVSLGKKYVLSEIGKLKGWVDSAVLSGGEPTLHRAFLEELCIDLKGLGLLIKLDTNGSDPLVLAALLEKKLINFVALDIKAEFTSEAYSRVTGVMQDRVALSRIKDSMRLLEKHEVPHLFRSTIVPGFHSKEDIMMIARQLSGALHWVLQDFDNRNSLDPALREVKGYGGNILRKWAAEARKYVKKVTVLARD